MRMDFDDQPQGFLGRWRERRAARSATSRAAKRPIEVHEHIEVDEAPAPPASVVAGERFARDAATRDERYHTFLTSRRHGRYASTGFLLAMVGILAALWIFNGVLRGETLPSLVSTDVAMIAAVVVLVVALLAGWFARTGNLLGLGLGWLMGLAALVVALAETANFVGITLASQLLVFAMGFAGLTLFAVATLSLASWAGARSQHRILGQSIRGSRGGAS